MLNFSYLFYQDYFALERLLPSSRLLSNKIPITAIIIDCQKIIGTLQLKT